MAVSGRKMYRLRWAEFPQNEDLLSNIQRHAAQKPIPRPVTPVIMKRSPYRAAYTIPCPFYPPDPEMSSTNAQKRRCIFGNFVERNKNAVCNPPLTIPSGHDKLEEPTKTNVLPGAAPHERKRQIHLLSIIRIRGSIQKRWQNYEFVIHNG